MDEWMNKWMHWQMSEWKNDKLINEWMKHTNECVIELKNDECIKIWINEWYNVLVKKLIVTPYNTNCKCSDGLKGTLSHWSWKN